MIIGIPKEISPGERRVALTPHVLPALGRAGLSVLVEEGAGFDAGYPDGTYSGKGARIALRREELFEEADAILQVLALDANRPAGRDDLASYNFV